MKKQYLFIGLFLMMSVLLAACGPADNNGNEGTPGVQEPAVELTETVAGLTETPGEMITEEPTEAMETPAATEEMVTETTEPMVTETVVATEVMTATEVLPPTGFVDTGRITNLLDFDVWNLADEQIGTVEDMILNLEDQHVDYIIVEVGGFLGIGGKLVAVPCEQFEVANQGSEDELQNVYILDVTREQIEGAPEFDPAIIPDLGVPVGEWDLELSSYWDNASPDVEEQTTETPGAPAATEPAETMIETELQGVILASDVLNLAVRDTDGNELAAVEDVIVDRDSCEVRYLVISISGIEELDGKWMLIPLDALRINTEDGVLVVSIDPGVLAGAPVFDPDEIPNTTLPDWDVDFQSYWTNQ